MSGAGTTPETRSGPTGFDGSVPGSTKSHPRLLLRLRLFRFLERFLTDGQMDLPDLNVHRRDGRPSAGDPQGIPPDLPESVGLVRRFRRLVLRPARTSDACGGRQGGCRRRAPARGGPVRDVREGLSREKLRHRGGPPGCRLRGPYRIVRHPIYLGYFVTHVGFLLANWSSRNVEIYIVVHFSQVARILSEERILREDESCRAYCQRVRYRVIPFIF